MLIFKNLLKNKELKTVAIISAAMLVFSCTAILWWTSVTGERMAEKNLLTLQIAFDRLDDIVRMSGKVIEGNSDFFNVEYAFDQYHSEFVKVVNEVKSIESLCPFIEEVVLYQKDSQRLITTLGSINKERFFNYAYETPDLNINYWNEIMSMYRTPTIIPVYEYTVLSSPESVKNLFVVTKIYSPYEIGALIFINEQLFWDYCGLSGKGRQDTVALYNSMGELLISNYPKAKDSIKVSLLRDGRHGGVKVWGAYALDKLFGYDDLIFHFSADNYIVTVSMAAILLLAITLTAMAAWSQSKLNKDSDYDYTFAEDLADLILNDVKEKEFPADMRSAFLEIRRFVNRVGSQSISNTAVASDYWHEPPTMLKTVLEKHIISRDMLRINEKIKEDTVRRIESGISYDIMVYYLFDLYMTVVHSMKDGRDYFADTHTLLLEGLKKCYLSADSEGMINLLANILRDTEKYIEAGSAAKIRDILSFIDNHYTQTLFIDDVAKEFSMTPKYFSRFFKEHAGIGFVEYITKLKLEKAVELLLTTDKSVKEISEMVGYVADTTFITAFKKYYGKPPKEYKNINLSPSVKCQVPK
jgi:two-component system response regulator YesN